MLILRRKPGEAIILNGVIRIIVLAVEGDRVKLGIDAPPDVIVMREELIDERGAIPVAPPMPGGHAHD
jgi:carbon storage regulator